MSARDMFHSVEVFGIIRDVNRAFVVNLDGNGGQFPSTELFENVGNVDGLFGCLGGGDYFSFA